MANLKAFDNVVKNEGIKYTEINTDTLGIKPNKIYILKQDEDKKFYIESLESIVETVKSLKDKSNKTRVHNLLGDNPVISNDVTKVINQLKDYYNNKKLDLALIYSNDELFSKFIELIYNNKGRKLSVKEIASIFHLNTGTIRNKCNKLEIYTKYFTVQSIKLELKIIDFLNKNHINYKTHYRIKYKDNNDKIKYTEIDIFIKNFNIGIELNDLDSHNILRKTSNYHYNKIYIADLNNIRLIHLWEWELNDTNWFKTSQWLLYLLNQSKIKLNIKDCIVKGGNYKENLKFLNEYSITSYQDPKQCCSIYYNNELIQLLSFIYVGDNKWYLSNICTKFGYNIKDGYKSLINYFKNFYKSILINTYVDISKFNSNEYKDIGFQLFKRTDPIIISQNIIENKKETCKSKQLYNCGYDIMFIN